MKINREKTDVNLYVEVAEAKIERALVGYEYVRYKVLSQTEEQYQSIEL